MEATTTANRFEAKARAAKVSKLVVTLRRMHRSAYQVEMMPEMGRRAAEGLAGVREASETTWAEVVAQLLLAERHDRLSGRN